MITLSAFADEIDADLNVQMDICLSHGVRQIDVRSVGGVNVSKFTASQAAEYRRRLADRGMSAACIGSPLGKIKVTDDFAAHMELLRNCCDVAHAFGTKLIRVFSFYPAEGRSISADRQAVMDRMSQMLDLADRAGCVLLHENEAAIYGAKPDHVLDLFHTLGARLKGIFDPANFVTENVRPYDEAWKAGLDAHTDYFHIKDKRLGEGTAVPAGQGDGQLLQILTETKASGWSGVMSLEPHLAQAGQFAGFSGPDRFGSAVTALKGMLNELGMAYQ